MPGYNRVEGLTMPITMDEYIRKIHKQWIQEATVEERLEGLKTEQRLQGVPLAQRLQGVTPEEVERLTPEDREKFRKLFENPPPT